MSDVVRSRAVHTMPGYRTLVGRVRNNVRALIRKHIDLPKQEIAEIVRANLRAMVWFAVAAVFALLFLIALVVLIIALIAIFLPWWASALIVMLIMAVLAGITGYVGRTKLELRGPTRSIATFKETIAWAKGLLGRRTT